MKCKVSSIAGANSGIGKGLKIEDRKVNNASPLRSESAKSPRLREKEEENTEQIRPKFVVTLSKNEIENDFSWWWWGKRSRGQGVQFFLFILICVFLVIPLSVLIY